MDDLSDFAAKDIVSIKLNGITHCFPKTSLVDAMDKSVILFASPSVRFKVSELINDEFLVMAGAALQNDDIINVSEEILAGNNNYAIPDNNFKTIQNILEFFRFYKWPLTSDVVISSQSFKKFIKSKANKFKLERVDAIVDASGFTAHGIGAVHGLKNLYEFVPINNKINKKRKFVKKGNFQWYYSSPKEYKSFVESISTPIPNGLI